MRPRHAGAGLHGIVDAVDPMEGRIASRRGEARWATRSAGCRRDYIYLRSSVRSDPPHGGGSSVVEHQECLANRSRCRGSHGTGHDRLDHHRRLRRRGRRADPAHRARALARDRAARFASSGIRAGRQKPGLLRQHLTAVQAATAVGRRACLRSASSGPASLSFEPSEVRGGEYRLAVGTAGSATLVFQTVLPALLVAREPSRLTLEGGTHNPFAPPFDFLAKTFLPILRRMGAAVDVRLETARVLSGRRRPIDRVDRALRERSSRSVAARSWSDAAVHAQALVASLPESIANRELAIVRERLGLERGLCRVETVEDVGRPRQRADDRHRGRVGHRGRHRFRREGRQRRAGGVGRAATRPRPISRRACRWASTSPTSS